jgi:hypothetical protein
MEDRATLLTEYRATLDELETRARRLQSAALCRMKERKSSLGWLESLNDRSQAARSALADLEDAVDFSWRIARTTLDRRLLDFEDAIEEAAEHVPPRTPSASPLVHRR